MNEQVIWFNQLKMTDVDRVGGKNASLGEMISGLYNKGVQVPDGFATTADAYRQFLGHQQLDEKIRDALASLDVDDVNALAETGKSIRQWIHDTPFPDDLAHAIEEAFTQLQAGNKNLSVAVRSSATAEDLPDASFAGQQETFLNIQGIENVIIAVKEVFASLFNDRAIAYRVHKGFDHAGVALSAGIQRMVRSETASSGVMFSLDTESGFDGVVFVTSSYGLGETVVQGSVNPDEFYVSKRALAAGQTPILRRNLGTKAIKMVYGEKAETGISVETVDNDPADSNKFSITDSEVAELAKQALIIEEHYGRPMDIEWAKDGDNGKLYIVQARPETVKSRESSTTIERYLLKEKGDVLSEGRSIGQRIGSGKVRIVKDISVMDQV